MAAQKTSKTDTADPSTCVGLIFRIVDQPRRVMGVIAISAFPSGIAMQAADVGTGSGLSPGWLGFAASGTMIAVLGVRSGIARIRNRYNKKVQALATEIARQISEEGGSGAKPQITGQQAKPVSRK